MIVSVLGLTVLAESDHVCYKPVGMLYSRWGIKGVQSSDG